MRKVQNQFNKRIDHLNSKCKERMRKDFIAHYGIEVLHSQQIAH